MKIARTKLAHILSDRFEKSKDEKLVAQETAAYLLSENRVGDLDSLLRDIQQFRAENGVVEVTSVSVFALSDSAIREIKGHIKALYPSAKKIIVNQQLEASALAGVRLELANQQLDLSIRGRLNKFKQLTGAGE